MAGLYAQIYIYTQHPSARHLPNAAACQQHPCLTPASVWSSRSATRISTRHCLLTWVRPELFLFRCHCRLQPSPWLSRGTGSEQCVKFTMLLPHAEAKGTLRTVTSRDVLVRRQRDGNFRIAGLNTFNENVSFFRCRFLFSFFSRAL